MMPRVRLPTLSSILDDMNIVRFSGVQRTESGCHISTVWTFRIGCAEVFRLNDTVQVVISVGDGLLMLLL